MTRFRNDTSGAAFIEMSLVFPMLLLLTFGGIQFGLVFYALSAMENTARVTARAIFVGEADDESGGALTMCGSISGSSANGNKSAEQIACDMLASLPGDYSVSASDGATGAFADSGEDISVTVSVNRSAIILADPLGLLQSSGVFAKTVTLRKE